MIHGILVFNLCALQSFCTTSVHVVFGLLLGLVLYTYTFLHAIVVFFMQIGQFSESFLWFAQNVEHELMSKRHLRFSYSIQTSTSFIIELEFMNVSLSVLSCLLFCCCNITTTLLLLLRPFYGFLDCLGELDEPVPEDTFRHFLDFLVQNEDNTVRCTNNPD